VSPEPISHNISVHQLQGCTAMFFLLNIVVLQYNICAFLNQGTLILKAKWQILPAG